MQVLISKDKHVAGRVREHVEGLEAEVNVLRRLDHPNIVRYLVSHLHRCSNMPACLLTEACMCFRRRDPLDAYGILSPVNMSSVSWRRTDPHAGCCLGFIGQVHPAVRYS